MTGEGKKDTEKWVSDKGAKYPYAYVNAGEVLKAIRARGYPSAALIDPSGTLVWTGHPARLTESVIEEHLTGALRTPVYEWPSSASSIASAVKRHDLGKALEAARKYAEKGGEMADQILADLESSRAARVDQFFGYVEEGNYLGALNAADGLEDALEGHDRLEEFEEKVAFLGKDDEVKKIVKGQRELAKIRAMDSPRNMKGLEKILGQLEKLHEKFPDGYLGEQIEVSIAEMEGMRRYFER